MPSILQIQQICFSSLSRASALLIATSVLVSGLSAAETALKSRVRIQAVTPPTATTQMDDATEVNTAAATAPAAFRPVVKAASLAVFQPPVQDPPLTPPPLPETGADGEPAELAPMSESIPLGEQPLSPSDQLNIQRSVVEDRGELSTKDNQYFKNLAPDQRELLYDGKRAGEFGIGRSFQYQVEGEPTAPPENIAQKVFSQEPIEDYPYGYQRDWYPTVAMWEAPSFYHRPLYFEEVNLERYGHRHTHLQPVLSAAHFFANTLALPYKVGVNHPCERIYTLGHYRPGDCNPHDRHGLPWSWRGAVYTGAVYTGVAFIP